MVIFVRLIFSANLKGAGKHFRENVKILSSHYGWHVQWKTQGQSKLSRYMSRIEKWRCSQNFAYFLRIWIINAHSIKHIISTQYAAAYRAIMNHERKHPIKHSKSSILRKKHQTIKIERYKQNIWNTLSIRSECILGKEKTCRNRRIGKISIHGWWWNGSSIEFVRGASHRFRVYYTE